MGSSTAWVKENNLKFVFAASPPSMLHWRSKKKDWLSLNQDKLSKWRDMSSLPVDSIFPVSYRYRNPTQQRVGQVQNKHHHHLIKNVLLSPWYRWKIGLWSLSNNLSITSCLKSSTAFNQYAILVLYFIFVDVSDNFFEARKYHYDGENNVLYMLRFFAIDRYDINEILMKMTLITITLTHLQLINVQMIWGENPDNGHSLHVQIS
jgi:hypothetical protein